MIFVIVFHKGMMERKKKFNKKGISAVVATVLIILITVAAVTIIWAAIIPLVSNQLEQGDACLEATGELSIVDKGFTCWEDGDPRITYFQIKRGAKNFSLAGIQLVTETNGTSYSFNNSALNVQGHQGGEAPIPTPNEVQVIRIIVTGAGAYPLTSMPVPDKVSISPIITLGTEEVICDVASTIPIYECGA